MSGYTIDEARRIAINCASSYKSSLENKQFIIVYRDRDTNKIEYIEKKPEMKALNIARLVIKCMENDYDFVIANFANPDVIGHTVLQPSDPQFRINR